MKVSRVIAIVVALHVLVIGGIFVFEGWSRARVQSQQFAENEIPTGDFHGEPLLGPDAAPVAPEWPATMQTADGSLVLPQSAPVLAPQPQRPLGLRSEASQLTDSRAATPTPGPEAQIASDLAPLSVRTKEAQIKAELQQHFAREERTLAKRNHAAGQPMGRVMKQANSRHPVEASVVHDQGWNGGSLYSAPSSIGTESYTHLADNPFRTVTDQPLSSK